jgi:ABC-type uncharacterized transport system permease subunit
LQVGAASQGIDGARMTDKLLFSLSAIAALVPSALLPFRRRAARDGLFWLVLAVATAGPLAWVVAETRGAWRTDFPTALWVTIAASMVVYAAAATAARQAWRLAPLVASYLAVLGVLAVLWQQAPEKPLEAAVSAWVGVHIAVSVATYGLVTIAALAALAATLQERALKSRQPTAMSRVLPSVADCESLVFRLLALAAFVLAAGLASGMALKYREAGVLLVADHKTVFAVAAFVVIGAVVIVHHRSGVRGRRLARMALLAYLLLTLGYPGVKFVTDVLLGRGA